MTTTLASPSHCRQRHPASCPETAVTLHAGLAAFPGDRPARTFLGMARAIEFYAKDLDATF